MGKFDRRNSMKMKRRKAQVKKKARIARHKGARKVAPVAAPAKKAAKKEKAPPASKA
jgi:hypothetical protein